MVKMIGCSKCRQTDDCGYEISTQKYDAGWLGEVESTFSLFNATEYMQADGEYKKSDKASLYFSLWKTDTNLLGEDYEIEFCPFCGAELKKVREAITKGELSDILSDRVESGGLE